MYGSTLTTTLKSGVMILGRLIYCQLTSIVSIFKSCLSLSVTRINATFEARILTFSPAQRSWWHWALSKNSWVRISRSNSFGDPEPQCICFSRDSFDLICKRTQLLFHLTTSERFRLSFDIIRCREKIILKLEPFYSIILYTASTLKME